MATTATGYVPIDLQVRTDPSLRTIPNQTSLDNRDWSLDIGSYFTPGFPAQELELGDNPPSWVSLTGTIVSGTIPDLSADGSYSIPVRTKGNTEFALQAVRYGEWRIRGLAIATNLDPPLLFVAEGNDRSIYAYRLDSHARVPSQDIDYVDIHSDLAPRSRGVSGMYFVNDYPPENGKLWLLSRPRNSIFCRTIGSGEQKEFKYPTTLPNATAIVVIDGTIYLLRDIPNSASKQIQPLTPGTTPSSDGTYPVTAGTAITITGFSATGGGGGGAAGAGGLTYFDGMFWVLERGARRSPRYIRAFSLTGTAQADKTITLTPPAENVSTTGAPGLTNDGEFLYVTTTHARDMIRIPSGGSASGTISLAVSEGDAPTISTIPAQSGTEGVAWSLNLSSYLNAGTQTATLSLGTGAPSWVSLSGTTLSGTPPNLASQTNHSIPIVYSSTAGTANATVVVSVPNTLYAPNWSGDTSFTATHDTRFTASLVVTGGPTPTISHISGSLPTGVSLSGNQLSGTPSSLGVHQFTLRVSNSQGSSDRQFTITVNRRPVWLSTAPTSITYTIGTAMSVNVVNWISAYPEVTSVSIVAGSLPRGVRLSGTTIFGTPQTGTTSTSVTLRATNSQGSRDLVLTHDIRWKPTWSSFSRRDIIRGQAVSIDLRSLVNAAPLATIALRTDVAGYSTSLPSGLSLNSDGVITGTLSSTAPFGIYYFLFNATNSVGQTGVIITLRVVADANAPVWRQIPNVSLQRPGNLLIYMPNWIVGLIAGSPAPTFTIVSASRPSNAVRAEFSIVDSVYLQVHLDIFYGSVASQITLRAANTSGFDEVRFTVTTNGPDDPALG